MNVRWLLTGVLCLGLVSISVAQGPPGGFGRGPGGPGGGFGGGDMTMMLLRDETVRKELDIVDSQIQKLEAISEKGRDIRELFSGLRDVPESEREAKFQEARTKAETMMADLRKQADEVLLPQQRDRLKQIALQARMRFQGTSSVLAADETAKALNLTEEQKQKIEEVQKAAEEEFRKEQEALRNKMRDKILEVLTPEQKAKWKEMVGNSFELPQPQFGRGGPGGRGPGGPGGAPPSGN